VIEVKGRRFFVAPITDNRLDDMIAIVAASEDDEPNGDAEPDADREPGPGPRLKVRPVASPVITAPDGQRGRWVPVR
jgi:hypothetical protein